RRAAAAPGLRSASATGSPWALPSASPPRVAWQRGAAPGCRRRAALWPGTAPLRRGGAGTASAHQPPHPQRVAAEQLDAAGAAFQHLEEGVDDVGVELHAALADQLG